MKTKIKILKKKIAILISGTGSNMEAIIKDSELNNHHGIVKFVLSNKPDALGIIKAKNRGIKTFVFPIDKNHSLELFEEKLQNLLTKKQIDLLCLAGFMKILSKNFLVFSDFNNEIIKTKEMSEIVKKFELSNSLIILDKSSKEKIEKSIRNIPNIKVTDVNHFSAFDMVKFKKVVFTESSVKELEKRYS